MTVENALPRALHHRGMSWSELARRTLLSDRHLRRLRRPRANPSLVVAERVAAALGVTVETLWWLSPRA